MSRPEAVRLGPFISGLNTASDPSVVLDSEVIVCDNMELDIDGSLISRPPIRETVSLGSWSERIKIIGRGIFPEGNYLIGSNTDGTYSFNGTTWTLIKAGLYSEVALQYQDQMYIIQKPNTSTKGGRWSPSGGFVIDAGTPAQPVGESAIFHKNRLFVLPGKSATVNQSRVNFSDNIVSTTLTWTSTNFFDVSFGDGQNLIDVQVYNDNLLFFKTYSTYVLAYDTRPADAVLRVISPCMGVSAGRCIAAFENSIFVLWEGQVFELVNYDFQSISTKVPFEFDGSAPGVRSDEAFLSLMKDRLVVRYFNNIYVFGLRTRTWGTWSSKNSTLQNFGPLVEMPSLEVHAADEKFYAGSSIKSLKNVVAILDEHDATTLEGTLTTNYDIECTVISKNYDFNDSHHFKRLMWWGADILTTRDIVSAANPVMANFITTWGDLKQETWGDLIDNTWGSPTKVPNTVTTNTPNIAYPGRIFVKFLKSLRFRQINFGVKLLNNGSTAQGPARVFSFTIVVGAKQLVSKKVS